MYIFSYALIQLFPASSLHIEFLRNIEKIVPDIEILKRSRNLNDTTDILLHTDNFSEVKDLVNKEGITYKIKDNYGRYL